MRRILFVIVLISSALAAQTIPSQRGPDAGAKPRAAAPRKIPCKTPQNASMCYWTRGRLSFYPGSPPTYRMWKVGTKRILGIYNGPSAFPPRTESDSASPEFPDTLKRIVESEYQRNVKLGVKAPSWIDDLYADFEVCSLEPERPGWMQAACIESAKAFAAESLKK